MYFVRKNMMEVFIILCAMLLNNMLPLILTILFIRKRVILMQFHCCAPQLNNIMLYNTTNIHGNKTRNYFFQNSSLSFDNDAHILLSLNCSSYSISTIVIALKFRKHEC